MRRAEKNMGLPDLSTRKCGWLFSHDTCKSIWHWFWFGVGGVLLGFEQNKLKTFVSALERFHQCLSNWCTGTRKIRCWCGSNIQVGCLHSWHALWIGFTGRPRQSFFSVGFDVGPALNFVVGRGAGSVFSLAESSLSSPLDCSGTGHISSWIRRQ